MPPPDGIPDDDTDVDEMQGLELQRERLKVQRVVARAMLDQADRLRKLEVSGVKSERYLLALVVGVYGTGVWGVAKDVGTNPDLQAAVIRFLGGF